MTGVFLEVGGHYCSCVPAMEMAMGVGVGEEADGGVELLGSYPNPQGAVPSSFVLSASPDSGRPFTIRCLDNYKYLCWDFANDCFGLRDSASGGGGADEWDGLFVAELIRANYDDDAVGAEGRGDRFLLRCRDVYITVSAAVGGTNAAAAAAAAAAGGGAHGGYALCSTPATYGMLGARGGGGPPSRRTWSFPTEH